jgi:hypothetical protein
MMGLELRFAKIRWPSRRHVRESGHQPPLISPFAKGETKRGSWIPGRANYRQLARNDD